MYLVADIGGTKIELAWARIDHPLVGGTLPAGTPVTTQDLRRFGTDQVSSFGALVEEYLGDRKPLMTIIGLAGPVLGRQVKLTNLSFVVDADSLEEQVGTPVILINDLEAHGWAVEIMGDEDLEVVQQGQPQNGNRAMIAAGTGLGEAILFWDGELHRPSPSEGGHCSFAPGNLAELEFLRFMMARYEHISWERVVSGIDGFRELFDFLHQSKRIALKDQEAAAILALGAGIGPALTKMANEGVPHAITVVEWFVRLYGAESGNLALKAMAVDGIYLGGSIVHHLLPWVRNGLFQESFVHKGRFKEMLEKIPIKIIKDPHSALRGAAFLAHRLNHPLKGSAER